MPRGGSLEVRRSSPSAASSSALRSVCPAAAPSAEARARTDHDPPSYHPGASFHRRPDEVDDLLEGEDLRPGGVEGEVLVPGSRLDAQSRDVLGGDGLSAAATAREDEDVQVPQQPRDVVQQYLASAEDERRTHDRIRKPGARERRLDLRLPAEVRVRRDRVSVRDAELNHASDTGVPCGLEERDAVRDGIPEACRPVGEADPVRVVERVHPPQRGRILEVGRERAHAVTEGARGEGSSRQRPHLSALREQVTGHVSPREGERACDEIHYGWISEKWITVTVSSSVTSRL